MKTFNGHEYFYQGKRLVTVTKNNKTIDFTYDLEGLIIQKEVKVRVDDDTTITTITNYYYDNRKLIKEVCGNNIMDYFYDENNQLYGYKENSTVYFYIRDVLGNIIGIIDNNGLIISKFDYDAFGNIINQTGTIISNFRYKGYYYDSDIELYYLKTRFYNPVLLRFITPDSIEYLDSSSIIGLNLYAYCGNDPVNMVDENGDFGIFATLLICTVFGLVVGTAISAGKEITEHGGDFSQWNYGKIGAGALLGAASGFAFGLGGVAGGMVIGSYGAIGGLTVTQSIGVLAGSAAITNFAAGVGAEALESIKEETGFNWGRSLLRGVGQAGSGLTSFVMGGLFSASGAWKVGTGAKNTFGSMIARAGARFVSSWIPNKIFEEVFNV